MSYIPDGGVCTAEERKAHVEELLEHNGNDCFRDTNAGRDYRLLRTVSALIAALEDAREQVEALIGGEDTSIRGMNRQELLDSLK